MSPLSPADEQLLVGLLEKLGPSTMPVSVFNALAAKVVLTGIELIILRRHAGWVEVLLLQRPADDPHWPGQWHIPGTILRNSDAPEVLNAEGSYRPALLRIQTGELKVRVTNPRPVGSYFHRAERGVVNSLLFIGKADDNGEEGSYFPVDELPDDIIGCHRPMIELAVEAYNSQH
ncbi:MAG: hypothetical protein JWM56_608 [Candidatus Peribacteria bacterium]|nr:hypothetical protein [Candidatus Peribacteria bacterium]